MAYSKQHTERVHLRQEAAPTARVLAVVGPLAEAAGVGLEVIFISESRKGGATALRDAIWLACRRQLKCGKRPASYPQLGRWFGRNHSSIWLGCQRAIERERLAAKAAQADEALEAA